MNKQKEPDLEKEAGQKSKKREEKKRKEKRMKVSGSGVKKLSEIIRKRKKS
jgi:hypothetical protein